MIFLYPHEETLPNSAFGTYQYKQQNQIPGEYLKEQWKHYLCTVICQQIQEEGDVPSPKEPAHSNSKLNYLLGVPLA